ncbi:hypothetical protein J4Q44_G00117450 [Coregonus suidteri]
MQATVLGLLAALTAVVLGWVLERDMFLSHATLLCSASVTTAFMASLLQEYYPYVSYLVCLIFLCLTPLWVVVSSRNPASRILLYTGWEPIITAMVISSIGGLILDTTVSDPNMVGMIVYTAVMNGVGGNLVAIQSSRIATDLHRHSSLRQVPEDRRSCYKPCRTFCGSGANHRSAQVLLLLVVPGHLIFLYTIHLMKGGPIGPTPVYITFFLTAALLQMDGDSSTTDASQLGMSGEYMAGSHYVLQSQDDDGDESLHDHEEGNGSKENFREQDIYLPIANVARIMKNAVPQTGKIAKDAKECVQECVSEFISFITSEASERCHQEKRKTINGEDILFAMSTLGFDMYVEPLKLYLQKFREAMKGEKGIGGVSVTEGLGEELTDDSFANQLPAGIITADGQQQNVMVYTTSYQQIPGVQQIQFS